MNSSLEIVEIKKISEYNKFVNFQFKLYSNNPYWVPPIINEEIDTINPNKNPVYNNSIAKFFLAYKNGEIVNIGLMEGLPYSNVTCIAEDILGRYWVGFERNPFRHQ